MKNIKLGLKIMMGFYFIIYVLLTFKFFNGSILNLQVYSRLQFIPIMFWFFMILASINLLVADTGFLKIGAVLGIVTSVFILGFQMVTNTSSFELVTSDKYELIVETVGSPDPGRVIVYKKDNLFFSKFIGSARIDHYYDLSYEIVGDSLILTMCSVNSCITDEIDLE